MLPPPIPKRDPISVTSSRRPPAATSTSTTPTTSASTLAPRSAVPAGLNLTNQSSFPFPPISQKGLSRTSFPSRPLPAPTPHGGTQNPFLARSTSVPPTSPQFTQQFRQADSTPSQTSLLFDSQLDPEPSHRQIPSRPGSSISIRETGYGQLRAIDSYRPPMPSVLMESMGRQNPASLVGLGGRRESEAANGAGIGRQMPNGPRSAAEVFMQSSQPRQTASDKVLAAIAEWGTQLSNQLREVQDENKSLRDQLHELQMGQRLLATREEVAEEITSQLSPALHEFFQTLHEKLDQMAISIPAQAGELVIGKNSVLLQKWKEATGQREEEDSHSQKPLTNLLNHLICKLDDVTAISTFLRSYKDFPQALSDLQVFKVSLDALVGRLPQASPAQVEGGSARLGREASHGAGDENLRVIDSLESLRASVDALKNKMEQGEHGDALGVQVLQAVEQLTVMLSETKPTFAAEIQSKGYNQQLQSILEHVTTLSREFADFKARLTVSFPFTTPMPIPSLEQPSFQTYQPTQSNFDQPLITPGPSISVGGLPTPVTSGTIGLGLEEQQEQPGTLEAPKIPLSARPMRALSAVTHSDGKLSLTIPYSDVFGPIEQLPASTSNRAFPPAWRPAFSRASLAPQLPFQPQPSSPAPAAEASNAQLIQAEQGQAGEEPFHDPFAFLDAQANKGQGGGKKKPALKRGAASTPTGPRKQPAKKSKASATATCGTPTLTPTTASGAPPGPVGFPHNPHLTRSASSRGKRPDPIVTDNSFPFRSASSSSRRNSFPNDPAASSALGGTEGSGEDGADEGDGLGMTQTHNERQSLLPLPEMQGATVNVEREESLYAQPMQGQVGRSPLRSGSRRERKQILSDLYTS